MLFPEWSTQTAQWTVSIFGDIGGAISFVGILGVYALLTMFLITVTLWVLSQPSWTHWVTVLIDRLQSTYATYYTK